MIKAMKIRLRPTKEQEKLFWQYIHCFRYVYNWGLATQNQHRELHGKTMSQSELSRVFTIHRKNTEWLQSISRATQTVALNNLNIGFQRCFSKTINAKYPTFKSRRTASNSFYVRYDYVRFNNEFKKVKFEALGSVKFNCKHDIPDTKYSNPYVSFDGKYWYLSFGIECEVVKHELTDEVIGIDVGLKDLAICSNGVAYKNINKTKRVKKLTKQLKQKQRRLAKKTKGSQNYAKLCANIRLIHRRLKNIRDNHLHTATAQITKRKPSKIVIEDLNIIGLMKNHHLAKAFAEQKLHEFRRQLQYKCEFLGIELVLADRFYPSSKLCSKCGKKKTDLKLSDRTYKCTCGLVIDRDLNASINLANYTKK